MPCATYLEGKGFHRARVEGVERLDPETEGRLTLVLRVEEGPRALVDRVELQGPEALEPAAVLAAALVEPSDPYAASEVVAARERILSLYRNQGFRGVEVESESASRRAARERRRHFRRSRRGAHPDRSRHPRRDSG